MSNPHLSDTQTTIQQALRHFQQGCLGQGECERLDVEVLLAHVLQTSRTHLHTWPEQRLTTQQLTQLERLVQRRCQGEPIAYLTGQREFWDMHLQVSTDTLIPRPETETLVEQALHRIPVDAHWQIADLGTGSGAIALAIARERPGCHVLATDISAAALAVARDNAAQLGISNVRFAEGPWCTALGQGRMEMIVSNPPYVDPKDPHLQQGDLRYEPRTALASAEAGLADIRQIGQQARQHLHGPGWLLLEHGYDQGPAVATILQQLGYDALQTVTDLAGHDRVSLGAWQA